MRIVLEVALPLVVLALAAAADTKQSGAGSPPLIDRELFFGNPEITAAQISPDGQYIAFLKPWQDTRNIWVKKTAEPFSAARLLTIETRRPVAGYLWSRDSRYVIYAKDNDGDENFNVYAVDPSAETPVGEDAPVSRDLTGLTGVRVLLINAPKNDPESLYIGLNDRDKAWHDLYKLNIATGEKTLVRENTAHIAGWVFDLQGNLRVATRVEENGDQDILRVDPEGFTKIYSCNVLETCRPIRFDKDGKHVYIASNKGDANLSTLSLLDPASGKVQLVEADPLKRVDFGSALFSEVTDELVMTSYVDDRTRRYFKDPKLKADYDWLSHQLPGKDIALQSRTADEQVWLVTASSDTEPGETYLFDRGNRSLQPQYKVFEKLPRDPLAAMTAVHYKSSDGLEIPAYLVLPKGLPPKSLPAIVIPHGGPWARDQWGYNPVAQFLANRGYAVLMPNFRGSTGYGKKFLNAGNGEWGRKMQDDITYGVHYLVEQGIADPKRIGIFGGSYGGYATLAGVAFTPDLYRAAVDIVGPANLMTLLEAIPPYWEAARKIMYARMADPGTPAGKAWLTQRSPLTAADRIKTALMVVQGANDPRVNRREAEQIVVALRDRGFPVEYLLAPDEGHGFARPVNNMAMFMATEKFLAKYLDGRYQADGTPEVVARLKEITVDPKTVTVTRLADASKVGSPKPAVDLTAGAYNYAAKMAVNGQEMVFRLWTVIKDDNGSWTAVETMQTPRGLATDTTVLEKGSLVVKQRTLTQDSATVNVDFTPAKASGKFDVNGTERPISTDLDGPIFADAAGAQQVIACLPLADGYSVLFRNFDIQKQKEKLMQLKVTGQETVTVPAGTFDAYRVELTSADGGADHATLWIARDSRKAVKMTAFMPQMSGATLTTELLP